MGLPGAGAGAAHLAATGGGGGGGGSGGGGGGGGGATDERRCFRLDAAASEAYALSGVARNACLHGVLSEPGSERRCSLNLRFGLHSSDLAGPFPAARVAFE